MNRKKFLLSLLGSSMVLKLSNAFSKSPVFFEGMFTLPALPYSPEALEPNIDKMTMEIHHGRHHKTYIDNLNKAVVGTPLEGKSIEELIKGINKDSSSAIRNNGGGHWNHTFFWNIMAPNAGGSPKGKVAEAINSNFGSFDKMKEEFAKSATGRFGSGWAWLIVSADKKLKIVSTPNQDNPLMDLSGEKGTPILGLDVWEHAYYLKYQNKRADYITAFWNVVNWNKVEELFAKA